MIQPVSTILPGGCLKNVNNIAFRVDATKQIGTGHFMRCLTLADELRKTGADVRFICRDLPSYLAAMLADQGISLNQLAGEPPAPPANDLAHSHWLWTDQEHDAQASLQALEDGPWDWIIVDHYALDHRWESRMRAAAKLVMAIDDLADRHHDCDALLDQNHYFDMNERYLGKVPEHCNLLLGPRYALLREEFRKLREHLKPRSGEVRRILVFFGGVDAGNLTSQAIKALSQAGLKSVHVDVVIGAQHPHRAEIESSCAEAGYFSHVQTTRMAELMAAADLAIGAGGIATWERCCLGLPALSICTAKNQRRQIADAAEAGLLYAPSSEGDVADLIRRHAKCLFENAYGLQLISSISMKTVDGKGLVRVAGLIDSGDIEIRRATENDSQKLFEWRNHPSIRGASRNAELIEWSAHRLWLESVLANEDRELLIGYVGDKPIGVVRFDKEQDVAEVSIYLVPETGVKGQGRNLLLSAERWLKANRTDIKKIRAEVLGANAASQRLFQSADYRIEKIHYLKELKGQR